jgi:hypothetical protein
VRIITRAVILAFALAAFASAAAQATVRSVKADGDPATTYTLRGRKLTIASTDPVVLRFVRGYSVSGLCYGSPSGVSLLSEARWGKHATSVTLVVTRGDPTDIGYCFAVRSHGDPPPVDFSGAQFKRGARRRLRLGPATAPPAEVIAQSELMDAWNAVNIDLEVAFPSQYALPPKTLPPATTLVEVIDAERLYRSVKVSYAPTVQSIKQQPDIIYVVGRGTSTKAMELAVRGLDGKVYAFHGKAGSLAFPIGSFGPA